MGTALFVPRVAPCDWFYIWLTGAGSEWRQATILPRGWRGNLKTPFFPPYTRHVNTILFCFASTALSRSNANNSAFRCVQTVQPFNGDKKPACDWLVVAVLVWNSGWTEDAVCRFQAAAIAPVILYCSCYNFPSVWCQERFEECLLHLQGNYWKLQQGNSTSQAVMSLVLFAKCDWLNVLWYPKAGVGKLLTRGLSDGICRQHVV